MSALDQIVSVTIDRNTTFPDQVGFGTPLIAAYVPTTLMPARTAAFTSLTEMTTAGFKTNDAAYKAASAAFSQNPRPPVVKIGRRANAPQQVLTITPTDTTEGSVHEVTVVGYGDSAFASRTASSDTATYTAGSGESATDICNGLRAAFAALNGAAGQAGDWADGGTSTLTVTASNTTMDGLVFGVTYTVNGVPQGIQDDTPDPGIAADLTAIQAYDPDWYGLVIDSNSEDEIAAAAAWVESNEKQFACQTRDPDVADVASASDTTSIAAVLAAAEYERTMLFYHTDNFDFVSAGMLGRALPETPGSITWAYKQIGGSSAQQLTTTQRLNLEAKNANYLASLAGVSSTKFGTASSGEYMDVMRGTDWLAARIQEDVYAALLQNDKIPFTDQGIQAIRGIILARCEEGVANGFLADTPEPTCTVPRASAVSAGDKASRTLNNVTFRATLAGAIHKVTIEGELNL